MSHKFPGLEINLNSNGVTIFCKYLNTPRFIPFDQKGRCSVCKSDCVEIDYVLSPEGVTIFCSRMKQEKFVPFDTRAQFGENDQFRIKSRSRVYNIPIGLSPSPLPPPPTPPEINH